MLIYAIGFRHTVPGEGVGGSEWDINPGAARKRLSDQGCLVPPYEFTERTFEVPGLQLDDSSRQLVSDAVDEHFWRDFYGEYHAEVLLVEWGNS